MSALLAGIACIVPTIFTLFVSLKPVSPGETGLGQVLRGEAGRFVLTAAILAGIFVLIRSLNAGAFFGTFALMQICQAVVPLMAARRLLKR